jgi:hypothetical protein
MSENTPEQSTQPLTDEQGHAEPQDATKPVDQWATGDEPATGPQLSYVHTLAREAGEEVPDGLTKADASLLIDRLQNASPRVD